MKTIELDDDLFKKLQELAIPFEETTPSIVLRRVIDFYISCNPGIDHQSGKPNPRLVNRKYGKLHHSNYDQPILETLQQLGGKGQASEVREIVFSKIKHQLSEIDFEKTPTGIIRWKDTLRCKHTMLVREGVLNPKAPRGIWELNPDFVQQMNNNDIEDSGDNNGSE